MNPQTPQTKDKLRRSITDENILSYFIISTLICFFFSGICLLISIGLLVNGRYILSFPAIFGSIGFFLASLLNLWIFNKIYDHWRNAD